MKELICVYQDCVMCGKRGKKLLTDTSKAGVSLRKVSFATPEGRALCADAVFIHKIKDMPFYADSEGHFSADWRNLVPGKKSKRGKNMQKGPRKRGKNVQNISVVEEEVVDGVV